jgi:outer membrane protein assembly factor BamB
MTCGAGLREGVKFTVSCGGCTARSTRRARRKMWRREAARWGVAGWMLAATALAVTCRADWPTFQHDNARSGITTEGLKTPLYEQWAFASHPPQPAWPKPVKELPRVRFDEAYHVAVVGDAVFFGSSADDKVYCLDASTGDVRWSQFTGGPIRLAPTMWKDRVFVGSDDGYAYCLAADDGRVIWRCRAAFSDRKVLGHGRMISLWPIRTSVLVDDGIAYFGAGVFPAENVFLCAVRADTGELVWRNDTIGEHGPEQDFGGVSPQGYLLASENKLYVPSGRAMPAAFDRRDGRFLYHCSPGGKVGGTWALLTGEDLVAGMDWQVSFNKETGSRIGTDRYAWFPGLQLVTSPDSSYLLTHTGVSTIDRKAYPATMRQRKTAIDNRSKLAKNVEDLRKKRETAQGSERSDIDRQIRECTQQMRALDEKRMTLEASLLKWQRPYEDIRTMILAGEVLLLGGKDVVVALEASAGKELWTGAVSGDACGLAVSGGRLYVSTDRGVIHCFGKDRMAAPRRMQPAVTMEPYPKDELSDVYAAAAESIVEKSGIRKGYCLVLGCGTGRLGLELARRTELKIIGIEPDGRKVEAARRTLDKAGIYGTRIAIDQGSLSKLPYSDYFANLIVSEDMSLSGKPRGSAVEVFRVLRPCGGVACFGQPEMLPGRANAFDLTALREWLKDSGAPEPNITRNGGVWAEIERGPLEGAGSWTHLYADPANTAFSDDQLVKCPLGVLWFGEPGPQKMVDRHSRAAGPLSMNGRLFVQGENVILCHDAYNGALLWEREIPGAVRVRADADGSNIAVADNGVFVAVKGKCLRLDPATGEILQTYELPATAEGTDRRWGYLAATGKLLFGSSALPLREYGEFWRTAVNPDGTWGPLPENASTQMRNLYRDFLSKYPKPNERAYAEFQYIGGMWEPMARFPQMGVVKTSEGAVTARMMTSDSVFALDVETGKVKWEYKGKRIAHPTISIGDETVFLTESSVSSDQREDALAEKRAKLETLTGEEAEGLKRELENADVRLVVSLNAETGDKRWEKVLDLTGCGGDRLGTAYRDGILFLFGFFSNHDRDLFRSGTLKWRRVTALSASDGELIWSKELGYLRRPVLMEDKLIVEPWMCDMRTGQLQTRVHPITGREVTWEFIRGGHSCGVTTASPHCFFLRSYSTAYYDTIQDRGMLAFGGIRGGCWLNIIMANGLVLYPEASSGCRCSFPVRSTVVFAPREPKDENRAWSLFPTKGAMTPGDGKLTPVKHLAINFGAPGDRRDNEGTFWFGYPRPVLRNLQVDWVMKLALNEKILPNMGYFDRNFRGMQIDGTDKPWVFASGCCGLTRCEIPLLDDGDDPAFYTVRMYFAAPADDRVGQRVFNVKLQDTVVLKNFDIMRATGTGQKALIRELRRVPVNGKLILELTSKSARPTMAETPLINAIEIVREDGSSGRSASVLSAEKVGVAESDTEEARIAADVGAAVRVLPGAAR